MENEQVQKEDPVAVNPAQPFAAVEAANGSKGCSDAEKAEVLSLVYFCLFIFKINNSKFENETAEEAARRTAAGLAGAASGPLQLELIFRIFPRFADF